MRTRPFGVRPVILLTLALAGCGRGLSQAPAPATAQTQAAAAAGKVAISIDDVVTSAYQGAAPSECSIVYDVFDNTGAELGGGAVSVAGHAFEIAALPSGAQYNAVQAISPPINNSCAGVAEGLMRDLSQVEITHCPKGGEAAGACSTPVVIYSDLDAGVIARVAQAGGVVRQH